MLEWILLGAKVPLSPIKIKWDVCLLQITQSGIKISVNNQVTTVAKGHQHDIGHLASSRHHERRFVHFSGTLRNKNTKENLAPPLCERWLAGLTK